MKKISVHHRRYVKANAPEFAVAIKNAKKASTGRTQNTGQADIGITTRLDEFPAGDMFLVYASIWYATSSGVSVTFNP